MKVLTILREADQNGLPTISGSLDKTPFTFHGHPSSIADLVAQMARDAVVALAKEPPPAAAPAKKAKARK